MKEKYIDAKIKNVEEQLTKVKKSKRMLDYITTAGMLFFGVLGASTFLSIPILGAASLAGCSLLTSMKFRNSDMKDLKIKRLEREKSHLENIRGNVPKSNLSLNQKRINKIKLLNKNRKKANRECKISKGLSLFSYGVSLAGIGAVFLNPTLALVPVAGLICTAISNIASVKNEEVKQKIENRIHNLVSDLRVIEADGEDKNNARLQANASQNNNGNPRTSSRSRRRALHSLSENEQIEQIVDDYLKKIEGSSQQDNPKKIRRFFPTR